MSAKVPIAPLTRSPLLGEFKRALKRRSKAIKHQVFEWKLERDVSEVDGYDLESLFNYWQLANGELSIRLWEDGEFWLYARDLVGGRIDFEFSFYAKMGDSTCEQLVETLEGSTVFVSVRDMYVDPKNALLEHWQSYEPYQVKYGRA